MIVEIIGKQHRISIHAPREGGDHGVVNDIALAQDFNPRPPRGGRLPRYGISRRNEQFQSTPPARGATTADKQNAHSQQISIHAPREGGDQQVYAQCV